MLSQNGVRDRGSLFCSTLLLFLMHQRKMLIRSYDLTRWCESSVVTLT